MCVWVCVCVVCVCVVVEAGGGVRTVRLARALLQHLHVVHECDRERERERVCVCVCRTSAGEYVNAISMRRPSHLTAAQIAQVARVRMRNQQLRRTRGSVCGTICASERR